MQKGIRYIIGIDEVGRGPLAGPLCVGACAVLCRSSRRTLSLFRGVKDCKQLAPAERLQWFMRIQSAAAHKRLLTETVFVGEKTIDERGISCALRTAISRVLRRLGFPPAKCRVLLDGGIKAPRAFLFQETIIRGDEKEPLIALASIAAKVRRDRYMIRLGKRYPMYGFDTHKGYGTKEHYEALRIYGPSPAHRRSFLTRFETRCLTDKF